MDIEVLQVMRRRLVPIDGMVGDVIGITDDGRFAILRSCGTVKVVAVDPDACAVQDFPCLPFGAGLLLDGDVQIKISCGSVMELWG